MKPTELVAEITGATMTIKLDQQAVRVPYFKITLAGEVGELSLDAIKRLQKAGLLKITLEPLQAELGRTGTA